MTNPKDSGQALERFRPTMPPDVIASWAADAQAELDALRAELASEKQESTRLRTALQKIADWDSSWGPFPENNAAWRAMVVVTAREAVPYDSTGG